MGTLVYTRGRDEQYAGLTPGLTPGCTGTQPGPTSSHGGGRPTVAVQFTPPRRACSPGMVGTIIDETANTVDVSATLVDLAVRGHLHHRRDDEGVVRAQGLAAHPHRAAGRPRPRCCPYEQAAARRRSSPAATASLLSELKNHFKPTLDARAAA